MLACWRLDSNGSADQQFRSVDITPAAEGSLTAVNSEALMDFGVSDDQKMLQRYARECLRELVVA